MKPEKPKFQGFQTSAMWTGKNPKTIKDEPFWVSSFVLITTVWFITKNIYLIEQEDENKNREPHFYFYWQDLKQRPHTDFHEKTLHQNHGIKQEKQEKTWLVFATSHKNMHQPRGQNHFTPFSVISSNDDE